MDLSTDDIRRALGSHGPWQRDQGGISDRFDFQALPSVIREPDVDWTRDKPDTIRFHENDRRKPDHDLVSTRAQKQKMNLNTMWAKKK